jgi:CRP-like cAMP-binding protein
MSDSLWTPWVNRSQDPHRILTELLQKLPVFEALRPKELKLFTSLIYRREYMAGETVFKEKEPGVGMYFVISGAIKIVLPAQPEEILLAYLGPGHFFGELALFNEGPRSATAVADEDSELAGIYRPDFLDYCQRNPVAGNKIIYHMANVISEKLRRTNREYRQLKQSQTAPSTA